mmetsp:Transcript_30328/g.70533  ORF Transcript_30328/g.70533 Transcript_30328/m.70533 type:complete len:144 (-) Transcript_30328:161-592(-)
MQRFLQCFILRRWNAERGAQSGQSTWPQVFSWTYAGLSRSCQGCLVGFLHRARLLRARGWAEICYSAPAAEQMRVEMSSRNDWTGAEDSRRACPPFSHGHCCVASKNISSERGREEEEGSTSTLKCILKTLSSFTALMALANE